MKNQKKESSQLLLQLLACFVHDTLRKVNIHIIYNHINQIILPCQLLFELRGGYLKIFLEFQRFVGDEANLTRVLPFSFWP